MTSWPSWSTPNGCARLGPSGLPNESVRFGFCTSGPGRPSRFTISGAASATTNRKTMNPSEQSATRSRRKRRQNSCSGERAVTPAVGSGNWKSPGALPAPPDWVPGPPHSSAAPVLILSTLPHWRDPIANTWQTRALSVRHGLFDNLLRNINPRARYWADGHAVRVRRRRAGSRSRSRARRRTRPRRERRSPAGGTRAPGDARRLRRPDASLGRWLGAANGDRAGATPLDDPLRAARHRQDDARADGRGAR